MASLTKCASAESESIALNVLPPAEDTNNVTDATAANEQTDVEADGGSPKISSTCVKNSIAGAASVSTISKAAEQTGKDNTTTSALKRHLSENGSQDQPTPEPPGVSAPAPTASNAAPTPSIAAPSASEAASTTSTEDLPPISSSKARDTDCVSSLNRSSVGGDVATKKGSNTTTDACVEDETSPLQQRIAALKQNGFNPFSRKTVRTPPSSASKRMHYQHRRNKTLEDVSDSSWRKHWGKQERNSKAKAGMKHTIPLGRPAAPESKRISALQDRLRHSLKAGTQVLFGGGLLKKEGPMFRRQKSANDVESRGVLSGREKGESAVLSRPVVSRKSRRRRMKARSAQDLGSVFKS